MSQDADVIDRPSLYDTDYYAWTQAQAAALHARGAGETVLDYDNLAEEVEGLGKSVLRGCRSQVANIVRHFLKLQYALDRQPERHWRGEIIDFRIELQQDLTRSLTNRLRPQLSRIIDDQIESLSARGEIALPSSARPQAHETYTWERIVGRRWFPEPVSIPDKIDSAPAA